MGVLVINLPFSVPGGVWVVYIISQLAGCFNAVDYTRIHVECNGIPLTHVLFSDYMLC